jgi:hypothetical protein
MYLSETEFLQGPSKMSFTNKDRPHQETLVFWANTVRNRLDPSSHTNAKHCDRIMLPLAAKDWT